MTFTSRFRTDIKTEFPHSVIVKYAIKIQHQTLINVELNQ